MADGTQNLPVTRLEFKGHSLPSAVLPKRCRLLARSINNAVVSGKRPAWCRKRDENDD